MERKKTNKIKYNCYIIYLLFAGVSALSRPSYVPKYAADPGISIERQKTENTKLVLSDDIDLSIIAIFFDDCDNDYNKFYITHVQLFLTNL